MDSKISSINLGEAKAAISVKSMHQAFSPGARVNTVSSTERRDILILPIRDSESSWETCVPNVYSENAFPEPVAH